VNKCYFREHFARLFLTFAFNDFAQRRHVVNNNKKLYPMKALRTINEASSQKVYEAPRLDVVEVCVEQGFAASTEGTGPSYEEEDVEW
jgi:hypothetical protein